MRLHPTPQFVLEMMIPPHSREPSSLPLQFEISYLTFRLTGVEVNSGKLE